jgi:formylmethanofuran dehydrogenase subunit A
MKRRFREYWTVEYDNYPVTESYLQISHPIAVKASV